VRAKVFDPRPMSRKEVSAGATEEFSPIITISGILTADHLQDTIRRCQFFPGSSGLGGHNSVSVPTNISRAGWYRRS
jgi:hypothetical protein